MFVDTFILASASPQRRKLLELLGISALIRPVNIKESLSASLQPKDMVRNIAQEKWRAYQEHYGRGEGWILIADTLVFLDHMALGKPENQEEARDYLSRLSSRTHQVWTAFVLVRQESGSQVVHQEEVRSDVKFRTMSDQDIDWYLSTDEWREAAGAYRIQGAGAALIEEIQGSYTNIVGLPLERIYGILSKNPKGF